MQLFNTFRVTLLALMVCLPHASYSGLASAAPRIEGFNVEEVDRLSPGAELNFEIMGTPGGLVSLHIEGDKVRISDGVLLRNP